MKLPTVIFAEFCQKVGCHKVIVWLSPVVFKREGPKFQIRLRSIFCWTFFFNEDQTTAVSFHRPQARQKCTWSNLGSCWYPQIFFLEIEIINYVWMSLVSMPCSQPEVPIYNCIVDYFMSHSSTITHFAILKASVCALDSLLARVLGRNLPNRVSGMSFLYPISICFATLLNDSEWKKYQWSWWAGMGA